MTTYGFVKQHRYTGDGTLEIQVRIPSIHGPYRQLNAKGMTLRNYVNDQDLPWYPSILLQHLPHDGEVVAIATMDEGKNNWLVLGLTGATYQTGNTNQGG